MSRSEYEERGGGEEERGGGRRSRRRPSNTKNPILGYGEKSLDKKKLRERERRQVQGGVERDV
eukprot:2122839-Pyramimonas_sp.AAC.1